MQNYQQKIQENNQLIKSLSSNQHNHSQQMPGMSLQQSEESLETAAALNAAGYAHHALPHKNHWSQNAAATT